MGPLELDSGIFNFKWFRIFNYENRATFQAAWTALFLREPAMTSLFYTFLRWFLPYRKLFLSPSACSNPVHSSRPSYSATSRNHAPSGTGLTDLRFLWALTWAPPTEGGHLTHSPIVFKKPHLSSDTVIQPLVMECRATLSIWKNHGLCVQEYQLAHTWSFALGTQT